MKISTSLLLCFLGLSLSTGSAAILFGSSVTTADGGPDDRLIVSSTGIPLTSGFAQAGYFSLSDSEVSDLAAEHDFSDLAAAFHPLGASDNFSSGTAAVLGVTIPGVYAFYNNFPVPSAAIGAPIYTLIFDSSSAATATEFALLKTTSALIADPAAPAPPNSYQATPSDEVVVAGAAGPLMSAPDLGAFSSTVQTIALVPVPEPSSLAVAIIGLGFGLASRRRRQG